MSTLLDGIASLWSPAARRYPITHSAREARYGPWHIYFEQPPIPTRAHDWHWYHDDFDGAPDGNDRRCGSCASFAAALNECDEYEDEANEELAA